MLFLLHTSSVGLLGCHICVVSQYTSPSAEVDFQPIGISQLPPKKTSEGLHHLSKHKKVLNKNPKLSPILLFHSGLLSTQPHLISSLSCDNPRQRLIRKQNNMSDTSEYSLQLVFLSQPLTPAALQNFLMHQIL